jgi:HTH-type transcriptional regulator, cell division transcriptional repressor
MQTGRPSKHPRNPFGQRLHAAREAAGLSQAQVADKLGIHQTSYADWERHSVALRPEQLKTLAGLFNVAVSELLGEEPPKKRGAGPVGKARHAFERVSKLPRATQQRILANVEDALTAYEARKAS